MFYIDHGGEYYKVAISTGCKEDAQTYLESISREVRYKGIEQVKKYADKKSLAESSVSITTTGTDSPEG